jgi:competence protein ComEC
VNWKRWGAVTILLLILWTWQKWPDSKLHVVFCDVGQGDASVIVLGSFQAVVDTGADEYKLTACLSEAVPFWDKSIEVVFLSHSDKDHVKALTGIKNRYSIGMMVDKPAAGDLIRYGNLSFDIFKGSELAVEKIMAGGGETNESSVVMKMIYGNFSVLFTGDIDTASELALLEKSVLTKTDVLKVSHHGSKYGSTKEFLEKVSPGLAIISVGAKNSYGHPAGDTLGRILSVGAKILRTDKNGSIFVETDGIETKVFTQR